MFADEIRHIFDSLGVELPPAGDFEVEDPSVGQPLARMGLDDGAAAQAATQRATDAFARLRQVPGPVRGQRVREMGERLRVHKEPLARLVCAEVGKGIEEARGEVQEMIDICDYACGLSRMFGGQTLPSERPEHRMFEQWHPLGPVLCISAFNFPVAVWGWNAAIALACGDPVVWKPSLKTPLTATATHRLLRPIWDEHGLGDVMQLVVGPDDPVAKSLVADVRYPLVSATGSCRMGRGVAPVVAGRLGRTLLELGGNNAIIVEETANLDLASRAIAFGAAGTAGQRCTSTRRLFVARSVVDGLVERLVSAYRQIGERIGDPRDPANLVGPLIDRGAREQFVTAIAMIKKQGGEILVGGETVDCAGYYVQPTVVRVPDDREVPIMREETFAPILYVRTYEDGKLARAIVSQNEVEQGLSSAIFTDSVRSMERFLGPDGSDCGIANVNIGTSGAEIGGAFGGEKATGGGREAGSDAWKAYMRRQTCTINRSGQLPLAQGIKWE